MPSVGFEPTISAGERPQTYALDCATTAFPFDNPFLYVVFFSVFTCIGYLSFRTLYTVQEKCDYLVTSAPASILYVKVPYSNDSVVLN